MPTDSEFLSTLLRHVQGTHEDAIEAHVAYLCDGLHKMQALLLAHQATLSSICDYIRDHAASERSAYGEEPEQPPMMVQ